MAIIAMCFHNLDEDHTLFSYQTYRTVLQTVDMARHRLGIFDNASTDPGTDVLLSEIAHDGHYVYRSKRNVGTAAGINQIWHDLGGMHLTQHIDDRPAFVKMDNDWTFVDGVCGDGWLEQCLEVFERDPSIGLVGLKRTDLQDAPSHSVIPWAESPDLNIPATQLRMLPQRTGIERWMVVELAAHVMGTCQVFSPSLKEKIGYFSQPGKYGFDDTLMAVRARLAGFNSAFLPHLSIRHLDPGTTDYQIWKHKHAYEHMAEYSRWQNEYLSGERDIYYDGGFE